jgi:hypothetical protein
MMAASVEEHVLTRGRIGTSMSILTTDNETVLVRVIVKLEMKNVYENITPSMMLVLFLSGRKERMGIKLSMQ